MTYQLNFRCAGLTFPAVSEGMTFVIISIYYPKIYQLKVRYYGSGQRVHYSILLRVLRKLHSEEGLRLRHVTSPNPSPTYPHPTDPLDRSEEIPMLSYFHRLLVLYDMARMSIKAIHLTMAQSRSTSQMPVSSQSCQRRHPISWLRNLGVKNHSNARTTREIFAENSLVLASVINV